MQAILNIITNQNDEENMTFTTKAECSTADDGIVFQYSENISDDETVDTCMRIDGDSVMVSRKGESGSDMFFKENTTFESKYKTVAGLLDMRLFTSSLDIKIDGKQVSADIKYHLFFGGLSAGSMKMSIDATTLEE